MATIIQPAPRRAEARDRHVRAGEGRGRSQDAARTELAPLTSIAASDWDDLAERAIEPNGYYLPGWELAVSAFAPGRTDAGAIAVWRNDSDHEPARLIGLLPAVTLWQAFKIPLPALVNADPYGTLGTPLLDRDHADLAMARLMRQARLAGARAILLRNMSLDGPAMQAIAAALRLQDLQPQILQRYQRAALDAGRDGEALLREALGTKRLKELRRQHNRLADHGAVSFAVASRPQEVASALEAFLALEASGWKGARGTALSQREGDARFIRQATIALAERGQCEIITLRAGAQPVAAGIVLRHRQRAFFFKIGIDERFAKFSPGVQLTLALTRHLCADPEITSADSTAHQGHPMIDPIWRSRISIGDVLIPLRPRDPVVAIIAAALKAHNGLLAGARRAARGARSLLRR